MRPAGRSPASGWTNHGRHIGPHDGRGVFVGNVTAGSFTPEGNCKVPPRVDGWDAVPVERTSSAVQTRNLISTYVSRTTTRSVSQVASPGVPVGAHPFEEESK